MKVRSIGSSAVCLLLSYVLINPASAAVTLSPFGFTARLDQNEQSNLQLTLANDGDAAVHFAVSAARLNQGGRDGGGPRRDNPGELLRTIPNMPYTTVGGMDWDGQYMWACSYSGAHIWCVDPANGQVVVNAACHNSPLAMAFDGQLLWVGQWQGQTVYQYDLQGHQVRSFNLNFNSMRGMGSDHEQFVYINSSQDNRIHVISIANREEVRSFTFRQAMNGGNADIWGITWVPAHRDGQLWGMATGRLYEAHVGDNDQVDAVQDFAVRADQPYTGPGHDGENMWIGMWNEANWYIYDDGVPEFHILSFDPSEGVVEAGDETVVEAALDATGVDPGTYVADVTFAFEEGQAPIVCSALVTVTDAIASISGVVTDPATGDPVAGAEVSFTDYHLIRFTDAQGAYSIEDLPAADYQLEFSLPDYLPLTHEVHLAEDDVELNVDLLHSECNLNPDQVNQDIAPDTDTHVQIVCTNDGNGPLTYTNELRLIGGANAAPWEDRYDFNAGTALHDDRIEGVAFDGEHFYFAGANAANPNTIYVTDRDGNETNHYTQLGASQYGMKDLEYDGELLWGAGYLQNVYGFTPEGDSVISFQTAYNPTGNIAYDSDEDLLWVSGTTSNISAYDRQGHAANRTLNRKGLKIYGMSYWPEDPDGYKLYIFDQPAVGLQMVHKMNTRTGDTLLVRSLRANNGEAPSGIFICNTYDVYSWVMMSMHNIAPADGSDRLSIWQLSARKEWMLVDPTAGVIQAGEHQNFDLHLNAAGLPAVEFRGELVFTHDGVHSETILPITLNVVEGPIHAERTLHVTQGWNLVSANLQPDEHDVTVLTQSLVDANQLVIMKDGAGNFYRPQSHFNNIPGWGVAQGYFMKLTEDADLTLVGTTVMTDDPIELAEGWQAVSYYPRHPIEATVALAGIADHLVIAKDGAGNFYIPSHHFSNLGNLVEGQGYMMKTDADVELVYQTGNRAAMVETGGTLVLPAHYSSHVNTGANMSLLIKNCKLQIANCGEIEVFTEGGLCVGSTSISNLQSTICNSVGIAVWGDDPTTEALDGALEGDALELRLRDDSGERRLSVAVLEAGDSNVAPPLTGEGELIYHTDGLAIATAEASVVPSDFSLTGAYPNPFNSVTRIGFSLPVASKVSVRIFDISGREVATLVNGQLTAGNHTAIWNAETASAGVYLVKMESGSASTTKKLMLVK